MNDNRNDMPDIRKEHAIETYKSLISIATESFKLLFILNGGAAIALLTFVGNARSKCMWMPDMKLAIGFYLAGLVVSSSLLLVSYQTQLTLYGESMLGAEEGTHIKPLKIGRVLFASSIACFAIGSIAAMYSFR